MGPGSVLYRAKTGHQGRNNPATIEALRQLSGFNFFRPTDRGRMTSNAFEWPEHRIRIGAPTVRETASDNSPQKEHHRHASCTNGFGSPTMEAAHRTSSALNRANSHTPRRRRA